MANPIIITICILLLIAYAFDVSSSRTKVPSVILLLVLGWTVQQLSQLFNISLPNLSIVLPVLGTIGLILIVLEGSLELDIDSSKLGYLGKNALMASLPMFVFSFGLAYAFHYIGNIDFKIALANAIPLAVISSAIAIPSVHSMPARIRTFITYESSLSDIIGVIFFNYITLNDTLGIHALWDFLLELSILLIISAVAITVLSYLLNRVKKHIKFVPIILMIILIYAITKSFHLPALLFVLLFGLFLGNFDKVKNIPFRNFIQPENLKKEVTKFRELTGELAFITRALFFLVFGYLISNNELFDSQAILWSIGIVLGIYSIRLLFLKLLRFPVLPVLFVAPRGLITILLFLSIPASQTMHLVHKSLIIQVIVLTALIMMLGMISHKDHSTEKSHPDA